MTNAFSASELATLDYDAADQFYPRSKATPIWFLPSLAAAGISYAAGGVPELNDIAFISLAIAAMCLLLYEIINFPRRKGLGGVVLYGAILVWWCHDYFSNFWGLTATFMGTAGSSKQIFDANVLAKTTFWHVLFAFTCSVGLLFPPGRPISWLLDRVPEPRSNNVYFVGMLACLAVGILPYFLFTSVPWYQAFYISMTAMRSDDAAIWTVGRTGNLNYNWSGYVDQLLKIGSFGGMLAGYYAVLIAEKPAKRIVGWAGWALETALAFGTGSRSGVVPMFFIIGIAYYLKYTGGAGFHLTVSRLRRHLTFITIFVVGLALVQYQGFYRNSREDQRDLSQFQLMKSQGNHMFSESLVGFAIIPETQGFLYGDSILTMILRPIPEFLLEGAIHPIPRALWNDKPVPKLWEWYNMVFNGNIQGREGTTIATGLVGQWYFPFGPIGVIEFGLFFGWLLRSTETALIRSMGKPLHVLVALAVFAWYFQSFRGMGWAGFYQFAIPVFALSLILVLMNSGAKRPS